GAGAPMETSRESRTLRARKPLAKGGTIEPFPMRCKIVVTTNRGDRGRCSRLVHAARQHASDQRAHTLRDAMRLSHAVQDGFERRAMSALSAVIEAGWERRGELTPQSVDAELRDAIETAIAGLDAGTLRVAEKRDGEWIVHQWL